VVVPGVEGAFSYRVPSKLAASALPGMRVLVPFGHRRLTGIIIRTDTAENPKATREIEHVLDERPAFSPAMLQFTRWMSEYYLCPWGDVLKAALPAGISLDEKRHWVLSEPFDEARLAEILKMYPDAHDVVEALKAGPVPPERMAKQYGFGPRSAMLKRMQDAGLVSFRPVLRPPKVKSHFDSVVNLSAEVQAEYGPDYLGRLRSVHEQHLLRMIFECGPEGILRSDLLKGATSARKQAFARLLAAGSLALRLEEVTRWDPHTEATPKISVPKQLTDYQQMAVEAISRSLERGQFDPFLLFGVTGSGKTQVYIEAIRRTLEMGKSALVLLPEIALTPFVWGRFYQAFGNRVAIQHSAQGSSVRFDLWRDIRAGRFPVVVGARSAVFAPLPNLGLVVVDEEQEASYKQEEPEPRYHARDAALMRARMEHAVIVLGSATPSIESFYQALEGRYTMLRLPERVGGAILPEVRIVQRFPKPQIEGEVPKEKWVNGEPPKKEDKPPKHEEPPILTEELKERIAITLKRGKQAILLQNRRGFSPFIICRKCGNLPMCPQCSVSLTYHRKGQVLRCHYCDYREPAPDTCGKCGASDWITQGLGTQRLEEELVKEFPDARILRMDSDTASRRGMHGRMVTAFAAGEYDVLAGTQMIAKGLDFPNVELSAVVQADAELFYPDFRASERGASLIVQIAGRSGRRAETGMVILQSSVPEHPVLQVAVEHDWETFVQTELQSRQQANFPPYARLILLRAIGKEETPPAKALLRIRRLLQTIGKVEILGPAPAMVAKIRELYRFQMLVRTSRADDPAGNHLHQAVRMALMQYRQVKGEPGVEIEVDVDPQSVS
jgi:primosomal protein N' (replication factor Y)